MRREKRRDDGGDKQEGDKSGRVVVKESVEGGGKEGIVGRGSREVGEGG